MTEKSTIKPFAAGLDAYTPLESLVRSALVLAGNFSVSRVDGEVMMLMISFANRVIEDVRMHPYWQGGRLDYYNDVTESRPVPDQIILDGITAYYMIQQGSEKAQLFLKLYQSKTTDLLYQRMYGNAPLEVNITDRE